MGKLIYIADDEQNIRELIRIFLKKEGFDVQTFEDGQTLLNAFLEKPSNMVIIDIMMPNLDGFSLCSTLRNKSNVPVIMVSARDSEVDRIAGLTLGGDDYLTKPFSPMELVIRVKSLFRRIDMDKGSGDELKEIKVGNVVLYPEQKRAECEGTDLALTLTELKMLVYLSQNRNKAVGREELLNKVWGYERDVDTRATDDTVKRLRKKLSVANATVSVETVWGFGFKISENNNEI